MFHLEDIVEQTGYVLEKDSEYSQKILEEEEDVSVSVTQKGGKTLQHQVTLTLCRSDMCDSGVLFEYINCSVFSFSVIILPVIILCPV